MRLEDVTERDQLNAYYAERDLATAKAKVAHLKDAMRIRAMHYGYGATMDEMLEGLEESAVSGDWKHLCH